jgi:uncharacterized protein YecT (DUF1311 family)
MKFSSNILRVSALVAAAVLLPASAMADSPAFKTGRYAFGPGANLDSFTCDSSDKEACKALFQMKNKLTKEEREHLGSPGERAYLGDFVITKEAGDDDLYSVKGGIFIGHAGDYTFKSKNADKAMCRLLEPNKLSCSVHDDDDNESTATLTFVKNNEVKLNVEISENSPKDPLFEELIRFVDDQIFRYETEKEYEHDMFISAKLSYLKVDADLNSKWKSLDKKVKDKILTEQRKWIAEKDKKCGPVTMKGSEKELTAMYKCQEDMTSKRLYDDLYSL